MERIAFILGDKILYWGNLILVLAASAAICLFLALYLRKKGSVQAGLVIVLLSLALSLVLSRIVHWYCYADSYDGFWRAVTDHSSGGYVLIGCFAGCFLAAAVTRGLGLHKSMGKVLDCMSLAGSLGIALGRLAAFFGTADRGQIVKSNSPALWISPVTNAISGKVEYRLATFLLQAMVAGALFLALLIYDWGKRRKLRDGEITLLFLLCYCASQIVLDSTRYDSLYFRFNGFVSIVQVVGAVAFAAVVVTYFVRSIKARGRKGLHIMLGILDAALLGCAGYMEYYVQRHGDQAALAYSVMSLSFCAMIVLTLKMRSDSEKSRG